MRRRDRCSRDAASGGGELRHTLVSTPPSQPSAQPSERVSRAFAFAFAGCTRPGRRVPLAAARSPRWCVCFWLWLVARSLLVEQPALCTSHAPVSALSSRPPRRHALRCVWPAARGSGMPTEQALSLSGGRVSLPSWHGIEHSVAAPRRAPRWLASLVCVPSLAESWMALASLCVPWLLVSLPRLSHRPCSSHSPAGLATSSLGLAIPRPSPRSPGASGGGHRRAPLGCLATTRPASACSRRSAGVRSVCSSKRRRLLRQPTCQHALHLESRRGC